MYNDEPLKSAHRIYRMDPTGLEIRCERQSESVTIGMAEIVDRLIIREPGARESAISPLVSQIMRDLDDCRVLRSFPEHQREVRRDVLIADLKSHLYTLRMQHHRDLLAGAKQIETAEGMRSWAFMLILPTHIASCTVIAALPTALPAPHPDRDWPSALSLF